MTPLEVLKKHYVGKKIIGGDINPNRYLKKILDVGYINSYEPTLYFLLEGEKFLIEIELDWNIQIE
jgi:hypothetical protein